MTQALFDTNIVIDGLRSVPRAKDEILGYDLLFLSRIAWIEVLVGVDANDLPVASLFLNNFEIIELTEPIARRAALLRQKYRRLKLPDAIIYATAQVHGLTLITRNTRDFGAGMPGVRIPYAL